jgi:hypothetical protein
MSMHKRKFFAALAVAGVVAAGGSAFTGGGLGPDPAAQFVGGSVTQTVTGTSVADIAYAVASDNTISKVTLTFGDDAVNGKKPALVFDATTAYDCAVVVSRKSDCTPNPTAALNTVSSTKITVA